MKTRLRNLLVTLALTGAGVTGLASQASADRPWDRQGDRGRESSRHGDDQDGGDRRGRGRYRDRDDNQDRDRDREADRGRDRDRGEDRQRPRGMSLNQAVQLVQQRFNARVVRADTEQHGDRVIYRLRLMNAENRVWTVTVDAASGSVQ